jgi:hypothetical protein
MLQAASQGLNMPKEFFISYETSYLISTQTENICFDVHKLLRKLIHLVFAFTMDDSFQLYFLANDEDELVEK